MKNRVRIVTFQKRQHKLVKQVILPNIFILVKQTSIICKRLVNIESCIHVFGLMHCFLKNTY